MNNTKTPPIKREIIVKKDPVIKKKRKKLRYLLLTLSAVGMVIIFILTVVIINVIMICSKPVVLEVGEAPNLSVITEKNSIRGFCRVDSEALNIRTERPATYKIPIYIFGFIKRDVTLLVVDSQKPVVLSRTVNVSVGIDIKPEMFFYEIKDHTNVKVEIKGDSPVADVSKNQKVSLIAIDEAGNSTEFDCVLNIVDSTSELTFAPDVSVRHIERIILNLFPKIDSIDLPKEIECGTHIFEARSRDEIFYLRVIVTDTTPPTAEVESFDIIAGNKISDDEIVKNIVDTSAVEVEFLTRADFDTPGKYTVKIKLTDEFGNVSDYVSHINVHNLKTEVQAELGSSDNDIAKLVFLDDFSRNNLSFARGNVTKDLKIGKNEIELIGQYNSIWITLEMIDTQPPYFSVSPKRFLVGHKVIPQDFITYYSDYSPVSFSFENSIPCNTEGTYNVKIIAKDSENNMSSLVTTVTFFVDNEPPVIKGHKDITSKVGYKIDYLASVSAYDNVWGTVKVEVDATSVDLNTAGEYKVKYFASDGSGNRAEVSVNVVIREPIRVCLNVSNIMQKPALPNGCEVVSLAIALKYAGYSISPTKLYDDYMPKSPYKNGDPWTTYVGDAKDLGYGCYAPCVVETGNEYLSSVGSSLRVSNVSGQDLGYYRSLIDRGIPVIMWGTIDMNGNSTVCWEGYINGKYVNWHTYSHCLVLIGYTDDTYIFCDPLKGITEYSRKNVEESFALNYRQACIVG